MGSARDRAEAIMAKMMTAHIAAMAPIHCQRRLRRDFFALSTVGSSSVNVATSPHLMPSQLSTFALGEHGETAD